MMLNLTIAWRKKNIGLMKNDTGGYIITKLKQQHQNYILRACKNVIMK